MLSSFVAMILSASEAGEAGAARSTVDCGVSGRVPNVFERGGSGGGIGRACGGICGPFSGFSDRGTTSLFCSDGSVVRIWDCDCESELC